MVFLIQVLTDPPWPRPQRPCPCAQTATFNRRPVSTHMSQLHLTTAGAGILNLLSIAYALRPQLRSRLTLGGRTFPRNPWDFGEMEFNHLYRYLCLHSHSHALQSRLPLPLRCTWDAFLLRTLRCTHSFGIWLKSRSFSAQFRSMGQLLRTV